MKMTDCQDLMVDDDDELQLRVPPVPTMPAHGTCVQRRPSMMDRMSIRRHRQKFFTVYDGLGEY